MGYGANTGVIIYWKKHQNVSTDRYHNDWFDKYNYRIYTEDNHTPDILLLSQYPESLLHI